MSTSSCPVFLSYQWDLQDTVKRLKSRIEESGIQCWMDIGQMGGGDALFSKIDAGVRACKVTPLFLKAVKGDSTLRTLHLESKFLEIIFFFTSLS